MNHLKFIFLCFVWLPAFGANNQITVDGAISDFFSNDKRFVVSTLNGKVITFDAKTRKKVSTFIFDKIANHFGEESFPEVFHVEPLGDSIITLTRSQKGKNDIYIIHNQTKYLILEGERLSSLIVDIKVIGYDKVLIGLLSNEVILYNFKLKRRVFSVQVSPYIFSAFAVSTDGNLFYVADESGKITKLATKDGRKLNIYAGLHKDNVLSLAAGNNIVVGGSKDRNVSLYFVKQNTMWHVATNHFVVIVAVSENGKYVSWYDDITNEVVIYSVEKWRELKRISGHISMVTSILVENERTVWSCDEDGKILINNF